MEKTPKYFGRAKFQPLGDTGIKYLLPFVFPLDGAQTFSVSSTTESDCFIPHGDGTDFLEDSPATVLKAAITVDENGQVVLKHLPESKNVVKVNGEVLEPGQSWRAPLAENCTVTFGGWSYQFSHIRELFDEQHMNAIEGIKRCSTCAVEGDPATMELRVLPCGGNICGDCRLRCAQSRNPDNRARNIFCGRRIAVGAAAGPPLIRCSCGKNVTSHEAANAHNSTLLKETLSVVSQVEKLHEGRPMCKHCENTRGLFEARDYQLCNACKVWTCPPCFLQFHREHEKCPPSVRSQMVDEVRRQLDALNSHLATLVFNAVELKHFRQSMKAANGGNCEELEVFSKFNVLEKKVQKCTEKLNEIEDRKSSICVEWDETSKRLAAKFRQKAEEAGQWMAECESLFEKTCTTFEETESEQPNVSSATDVSASGAE